MICLPIIGHRTARSDAALDSLDVVIGDLRNELDIRGLRKDAAAHVGDQGPDVTHRKMSVYEAAVRIPFLLKAPGADNAVVREKLVSPDWQRYSFAEYSTQAPDQFCPRYAVRDERYKLIFKVLVGESKSPLATANCYNAWWESHNSNHAGFTSVESAGVSLRITSGSPC